MSIKPITVLSLACALAAMSFNPARAQAPANQGERVYDRDSPIHIIVPLAGGGGTDTLARIVAMKLREDLRQNVVVENRPGAAGNIGAEYVYRATPDGHTLLFTQPGPITVNQWLYPRLGFVPEAFVPVATASLQDIMLAVNPTLPVKDLNELIAYAKAHPGKLNYGSSGVGTAPHLAAELFQSMADVKMVHVPYKGSAESMNATLGGQVDLTFFAFSSALPHARAGKVRALAVGGTTRNAQLPDIPAIAEVLPGYNSASWTGLFAPPGTPDRIINRLAQATNKALEGADVQKRLLEHGDEPLIQDRQKIAEFLAQDRKRWEDVIRTVGIQAQ